MKFNYVPWGCGVWPAFYTIGRGPTWPYGGEMDILEHVNDMGVFTSFHTGKDCQLDEQKVSRFTRMTDVNNESNDGRLYDCKTKYCADCKNLGCAPNNMPLRGAKQWAEHPGVVMMERTPEFVKIFYIPMHEFPDELNTDQPIPEKWSEYIISYYPFAASPSCPNPDDVMAEQEIVLSIAFCGDWASKVWAKSETCYWMGPPVDEDATEKKVTPKQGFCRAVDPLAEYAPNEDCCTHFVGDPTGQYNSDTYLHDVAHYDLYWLKVYTPKYR